jgi:hypothetical protein
MKTSYYLVLIALLLAACSSATSGDTVGTSVAATMSALQLKVSSPAAPQPTVTTASTITPVPTATSIPTATEVPTLAPTPSYSEPVVLAEITGTGVTVTDDYQLPKCWRSLLYWHVAPNSYGTASLILTGYNHGTGGSNTLVNEVATDVGADGLSGVAFNGLLGGRYYFQTENTDEAWSLRLECQDGIAPAGEGMNIQANGATVTDNYTLHACSKSIFNWSVEPNSSGTASLIVSLCSQSECHNIINEVKTDMTSPMTGQALQALKGGDYFLVSENTQQAWSVSWECED